VLVAGQTTSSSTKEADLAPSTVVYTGVPSAAPDSQDHHVAKLVAATVPSIVGGVAAAGAISLKIQSWWSNLAGKLHIFEVELWRAVQKSVTPPSTTPAKPARPPLRLPEHLKPTPENPYPRPTLHETMEIEHHELGSTAEMKKVWMQGTERAIEIGEALLGYPPRWMRARLQVPQAPQAKVQTLSTAQYDVIAQEVNELLTEQACGEQILSPEQMANIHQIDPLAGTPGAPEPS